MKSSRLRPLALALAAGSLMMSTQVDAAFAVLSASANPAATMVTISGSDLVAGPKKPQVYLGTKALEIVGTATNTEIVAVLPPVAPGTYLLIVTNGPGAAQMEEMWITIGAVGPQGPQGEKGDKGDAGAPGTPGLPGSQGIQGIQGIQGLPGVQGVPGQSVTVAQIPVGDPRCPGGGAAISAGGETANVCGYTAPPPATIPGSNLIGAADFAQITNWARLPAGTSWTLCYRQSTDGASASTFHAQCDNKGPTFVVARTSAGKTLGGYAGVSWTSASCSNYKSDPGAFLFSISNSFRHGQIASQANFAIFDCSSYGPTFGGALDLKVQNGSGSTGLGHTYECRVGAYNTAQCQNDFAGAASFTYTEVEVFYKS